MLFFKQCERARGSQAEVFCKYPCKDHVMQRSCLSEIVWPLLNMYFLCFVFISTKKANSQYITTTYTWFWITLHKLYCNFIHIGLFKKIKLWPFTVFNLALITVECFRTSDHIIWFSGNTWRIKIICSCCTLTINFIPANLFNISARKTLPPANTFHYRKETWNMLLSH